MDHPGSPVVRAAVSPSSTSIPTSSKTRSHVALCVRREVRRSPAGGSPMVPSGTTCATCAACSVASEHKGEKRQCVSRIDSQFLKRLAAACSASRVNGVKAGALH